MIKNLIYKIFQQLFFIKKPTYILHWRYIIPFQSDSVRAHRKIFIFSIFQYSFLSIFINLWRCLFWYAYYAWKQSYVSWKKNKGDICSNEINSTDYFIQLLKYALMYNLSCSEVNYYKLFLSENRRKVFQQYYKFEFLSFLNSKNMKYKFSSIASNLLADKLSFCEALKKSDIPCVHTSLLSEVDQFYFELISCQRSIFIKPRYGSCGQGAFEVRYDEVLDDVTVCTLRSELGNNTMDIKKFITNLINDSEYIYQPLLENHPDLILMFSVKKLITFRLITIKRRSHLCFPRYLRIEVPVSNSEYDVFYEVDLESQQLTAQTKGCQPVVCDLILSDEVKLYVRQAINFCILSHLECFDCYSIGFDFCISPNGPLVIEGNYTWFVRDIIGPGDSH